MGVNKHPLFLLLLTILMFLSGISAQTSESIIKEYTALKKRVFNYTKIDFITSEGEFNEAICTLVIPEFKEDSPPYVAIYYKRDQSEWFTESLYRKRLRFSFKNGIIKLDRSNFWDWFELAEIKIVVIY